MTDYNMTNMIKNLSSAQISYCEIYLYEPDNFNKNFIILNDSFIDNIILNYMPQKYLFDDLSLNIYSLNGFTYDSFCYDNLGFCEYSNGNNFIFFNQTDSTPCESWTRIYNDCLINETLIEYYDANTCGTYDDLPIDNNTIEYCVPCLEEWIPYNTTCMVNQQKLFYLDNNQCGTYNDLPDDNNTISLCGILSDNDVVLSVSSDTLLHILIVILIVVTMIGGFFIGALLIPSGLLMILYSFILQSYILNNYDMIRYFMLFIGVMLIIIGIFAFRKDK
jgi:hypothetical protein